MVLPFGPFGSVGANVGGGLGGCVGLTVVVVLAVKVKVPFASLLPSIS